jgi:hypothetical protein
VSTVIEFRGSFRFMADDGARLRPVNRGTWVCRCGGQPIVERRNPRCDVCAAGGNCGMDCALSNLTCPNCGSTL